MARIRTVKPEFFTDEAVADLPPLVRLFFIGVWCHADKAGRLKYRPRQLKVQILPFDDVDGEGTIEQLVKARLLIRYESEGEEYLQVRTWDKHQKPHHTERDSDLPPCPNGARTVKERTERKGKEGKGREGEGSSEPSSTTAEPKVLMEFPCVGEPKTFCLTEVLVATLRDAYPDLDRETEYKKAKAWLETNTARRKTARGMPAFLNRWFERAQNGRGGVEAPPEPVDLPYREH